MLVLFYGCKQLSHTEKNTYDFEQAEADTIVSVKERIVDTITMVFDTPSGDTLHITDSLDGTGLTPSPEMDSINETQDFASLLDTLQNDTTLQRHPRRITPQRSESAIETQVICSAADSSYRDMNQTKIFYYGQAEAKYDDIVLKADYLEFDLETSTCTAHGLPDSTGKIQGRPVFTQGETTFEAMEMRYNFKTKKGIITKVWTEEQGGYLHGERVKRMDDNSIHIRKGGYTTCDLKDHPHYQFKDPST